MRMVSHAPTRTPQVWLTAAVCAVLACLAWSTPALAASPPAIVEEFVTNVASTSATLQAQIDPGGEETSYRFEYGTTEAYGSSVPLPAGLVGSGTSAAPVLAHVQGLLVDRAYHYRVVAHSALGTVDGEDETFLTQPAGGELALPDGRQWELVSAPDRRGALLDPLSLSGLIEAASSGSEITYVSRIPTEAEPEGFTATVQNLATRGLGGWETRDLTIPHGEATGSDVQNGTEYRAFSSDLSLAVVQPLGSFTPCRSAEGLEQPCLVPEASEQTALLATNDLNGNESEPCVPRTMRCFQPLVVGCPKSGEACPSPVAEHANVPDGTVFGGEYGGEEELFQCSLGGVSCGPKFVAATPDFRHLVVYAEAGLTPGSGGGLYEWTTGKLAFIGSSPYSVNPSVGGRLEPGRHPVSDDGSRVVFTGSYEGIEGLVMRDMATGEAVQLDAVQGGSGAGPAEPVFQFASSDGSRVFFTDEQRLTPNAGAAGGAPDLYVCEMVEEAGKLKCKLSDLTPARSGESAAVQGSVLGAGEDGSYVYFVANGALTEGSVHGTCTGESERLDQACGLYALHNNGSEWESPKLVAVLVEADSSDWQSRLVHQPTRVSPNGEWLTFMSQARLTAYDNRDAAGDGPDAEVYLYDARSNRLVCASCVPTGERPIGVEYQNLEPDEGLVGGPDEAWAGHGLVAANLPGWQTVDGPEPPEHYQSRYLSNSGRLFFDSNDALVPQDVNGTEDVYEYEQVGVGGCASSLSSYSAPAGGCVGLISSGISGEESAFLDASESGGDVFFLTAAKLVPQEVEAGFSLYDAHECTSQVPCSSVPVAPPPCETEASCRPAPTPQPAIFGAPASATLVASGNLASPSTTQSVSSKSAGSHPRKRTCPRGKRLSRGRCVRVKRRRKVNARQVIHIDRRGK
jgi:hypothetical protein